MNQTHRFVLENMQHDQLLICIEPEAHELQLLPGEEVVVHDPYLRHPAVLRISKTQLGDTIIAIWPGDGRVRVEKEGVDALEIVSQHTGV